MQIASVASGPLLHIAYVAVFPNVLGEKNRTDNRIDKKNANSVDWFPSNILNQIVLRVLVNPVRVRVRVRF